MPPDRILRRWSFFFGYLLLFPLLLQLLPLCHAATSSGWLNWCGAAAIRLFTAVLFIKLLPRMHHIAAYIIMGTICLITGVVNLLDIYLLVNFGTVFNYEIWHLISTAPSHEVSGFFRLFFFRFTTFLILLIYPAAGVIIFCIKKHRSLYMFLILFTAAALFILNACGAAVPGAAPDSPGKRLIGFVKQWQDARIHREIKLSNKDLQAENSEKSALYLLVIGESHSKRRSSVYGYPRNTMPEMKKLFQQGKIFRFGNVTTPHVMTHLAIPKMLTLADSATRVSFYELPNIPDIFRTAGFKVWYIYNQLPDDSKKLPFLAIARRADEFISFSNPVRRYDSAIPAELKKIFCDDAPKKFIIIQLLGNHWEYSKTFPPEFARFKDMPPDSNADQQKNADIINAYDNSLCHTDKVLAEIIATVEQTKKNAFVLYLPDHGEALYEEDNFVGHTNLFPTASTVEIPMLLWLSEQYITCETEKKLKHSLNAPFCSENLPHLLMELGRIKSPCFIPERSITSQAAGK